MKEKIRAFFNYEGFIFIGVLMTAGTVTKLSGLLTFSSDWFWLLAGIGLIVEGTISMIKQRRFDRKFKIIEVDEKEKKN
jgi:hypothetical protein